MAKRTATTDLNHDNWNAEDESEEAGTYVPLGKDELKNRVIRKARRSLNTSSGGNSLTGSSPFASFAGFSSGASPFASLKKSSDGASPFASLKKSSDGASPFASLKKSSDGASPFASLKKSSDGASPFASLKTSSDGASTFSFLAKKPVEKTNGSTAGEEEKTVEKKEETKEPTSSAATSNTNAQEKQVRSIEYYEQLQSLNESVLKWMQLHLAKNPCCDFTPVFNDYKKHMDTLNVTYPVRKKEVVDSKPMPSKSSTSLSNSKASSPFLKGNTAKGEDESNYGAHFSSNTTNTSTFSFGCKMTPTATSTGSPLGPASSSKEDEKNKQSEFSAGFFSRPVQSTSDKPFSFATAPAQKSESGENEDQEYVPPKNDFVAVNEEDAFYSKRCKLFFKKEDSYAEKGVGTLYLKSLDGKTQLLIRADTSLGNILLNIRLGASLPMSRTGKNNVLLVCIPNPPVDAKNPDSKEAIPILIRVKSSEDADELLKKLEENKS